ncbi:MAG TPA: hypothetical protein VGG64_29920 [Pirellulales bacterium]|jgi:hypothetical protein
MADLNSQTDIRRGIDPVRVTDNTVQNSQIIDRAGWDSLMFVIATGTIADADATFQVSITEGNASNLSDGVAATSFIGILGVAATPTGCSFRYDSDDQVLRIGYTGLARYVQLTITPATNTGNADISCVVILGHPRTAPNTRQVAT